MLATIRRRVRRLLVRRGLEANDDVTSPDPLAEESLALGGPKTKIRVTEQPIPTGHRRYWGLVVHTEYVTVEALLNSVGAP